MIGFCSSPRFVEHQTGPRHPERPDRIRAVYRALHAAGLLESRDPFPDFELDLGPMARAGLKLVDLGAPEPVEANGLYLVHAPEHVAHVQHVCELGGGVLDQGDTPVGHDSYDLARLGVGAVLRSCDAVMNGEVRRAFAATRPPGHHAEPDRAMGFCLFSNVALAARHLQRNRGLGKIAVVDFDVHHGNGTQAAFEADPSVLFISLHQHPRTCYPGTGYDWETGEGPGKGTTLNLPFPPGSTDDAYLAAFDARVLPALDAYRPEFLLISAGFDAHRDDPLAQVELSESCYEAMTRRLVEVAERHCEGRVVSALEGGYNLRALGRSVVRHLVGLRSQ
jgi:acetoin utilization deacetylase AcuC-like enzyme